MMGLPVRCSRLARAPAGPISSGLLPGRRDVRPHARTVGRNGRWNEFTGVPRGRRVDMLRRQRQRDCMDNRTQAGAVFVGRQRELGTLLEGLESAVAGRGRLILVGGEPGIGKSRLADELAGMARDRGIGVLWGRGWEDAGAPAYWPWVQALRTLLRTETPEAIRGYLGSGAADVAQILPELRTILPDLPSRSPDSDAARFQLFDSTADLIRHAAARTPDPDRPRRPAGGGYAIDLAAPVPREPAQRHASPDRRHLSRRRADTRAPVDAGHRGDGARTIGRG